jgi:phosphoglycerate dehydrogenase-like enzyme
MSKDLVLLLDQIKDDTAAQLTKELPELDFIDARQEDVRNEHLAEAIITYGKPSLQQLPEARKLRWISLLSAGVPRTLCAAAQEQGIVITNLAGLYGLTIAEHTLALMTVLARNLHLAVRNQVAHRWDSTIARGINTLCGQTVAIVGMGNIGQAIGRLAQAHGMRVIGCRRRDQPTPYADRIFPLSELRSLLAQGDFVVVAAPLTSESSALLGRDEFAAMKPGAFFLNISRGKVADEVAMLEALRSGHLAGAGLDVFGVEPLPADHPFWDMPQVIITPHYSGDPVNAGPLPLERFRRNLRRWRDGRPLEHIVDLEQGY